MAGEEVNSLADVQDVIDGLAIDEPIAATVKQDGHERTLDLGALGPNILGANTYPGDARLRLKAAIERGDLDPEVVRTVVRPFFQQGDLAPDQPDTRIGAITSVSSSSISIEVYSTGEEWTLAEGPLTVVGDGSRSLEDLHIGEFVQLFTTDGQTAGEWSAWRLRPNSQSPVLVPHRRSR